MNTKPNNDRLQQLLAKVRQEALLTSTEGRGVICTNVPAPATTAIPVHIPKEQIPPQERWHPKQQEAIDTALAGKHFCLIGAAGTGKTTVTREIVAKLLQAGHIPPMSTSTKFLREGSPGVVICSFTRKAVNNIRKGLSADLRGNCLTIHALLEFEPEDYEYQDAEGNWKKSKRFMPQRVATNPLPQDIKVIIFEESSMISTELFQLLLNALHHKPLMIFLGDIQQLPPVYGTAVLGYRLLDKPVVELTHVYRQALESPIIRLAHHILAGKVIYGEKFADWNVPGKLTLHAWKKQLSADHALMTAGVFFKKLLAEELYNPEEDIILMPFNKAFGTLELNKHISQFLGAARNAIVHEIIAGFEKQYLAIGDKILYDKREAVITSINKNAKYFGQQPQPASTTLDRWGHEHGSAAAVAASREQDSEDMLAHIDEMLANIGAGTIEDRTTAASHVITLKLEDTGEEISIDSSRDVNNILLGYALTVHKAQGSEWRKVFLLLHKSHAVMLQRELLYTAVTRAREELYVICEKDTFVNGVIKQKIRGNTLAEKAEYFKGKKEDAQRKLAFSQVPDTEEDEE